jgi:hypothetical protein
MVEQILITIFAGTHDILNSSQVHKEKCSFCVTLKEFGLILIPNVLLGIWKIYWTKQFREIKFNEISWNFTKFKEI